MIQENTISYIQRNTYQKTDQENIKKMRFDRILRVTPLQDAPQKKLFYNEDMRGYIESPHTYIDYEVEIEKARCYFDPRYYKFQDFHRRITYRYDWMQFRIETNARHQVLNNVEYLRKNWAELESLLRKDYIGAGVDLYLQQITEDFGNEETFDSTINNYFYYGLLFPPIPRYHNTEWQASRKVLIADDAKIILKETISFESEDEKTKKYRIDAQCLSASINVLAFGGTIEISKEIFFLEKAQVDIEYQNRLINTWHFSIERLMDK